MRWTLGVVLAACVACHAERAPAHRGATGNRADAKVVPGLVAIDWKEGVTKEQIDAEQRQLGINAEYNSVASASEGLTTAQSESWTDALLAKLRADPLVEGVEQVYEYDSLFLPNDPDYKKQWHMQQIGAEEAWNWGSGADVIVAVIDTGVSELSDLPNVEFVPGYDFVHDRPEVKDDQGHGSHVAGTIAQATDNGAGVTGLAHNAKIMPLKVLSASGAGTTVDIADAIRWAVEHGAKVLNLSLGGGGYSHVLAKAVKYAHDKGAVVVCAAGNGSGAPVSYPAAYEGAVAVSAVRFDRKLAPYSSFGPEVDLAAPGGDVSVDQNHDGFPDGVLQQTIGGQFKWMNGTSMAAPHVAGAAALLAGAGVTRADAIERIMMETATPLGDKNRFGAGEVDAAKALREVRLFGGFWRLAIAVALLFLARWVIRRNGEKPTGVGLISLLFLVWASSGLFFLPMVGVGHSKLGAMLATPLPEWGQMLHGSMTSSILWLSALGPFLAMGLSRLSPIRSIAAAVCLGYGAYLLHAAAVGWVDISWLPGRLVEAVWLGLNGLLAFGFGTISLRPQRS